jgi:energy-converting hydrogenase Eha subunit G
LDEETKSVPKLECHSTAPIPQRSSNVVLIAALAACVFGVTAFWLGYLGWFTPDREWRGAAIVAGLGALVCAAVSFGLID